MTEDNKEAGDAPKVETTPVDEATKRKIAKQIEYYFSDFNLPKDKFLYEKTKEDDGWIALDVLLTFNRLKTLCTDKTVIATTLRELSSHLLEVSEDGEKIRRLTELPIPDNFKEMFLPKTVYVKGFPLDITLDAIIEFMSNYGKSISVKMRRFPFKQQFKGSVFVTFGDEEEAKKFVATPDLKYNGIDLIIMMAGDYQKKKKVEYEERAAKRAAQKASKEKAAAEKPKEEEPPKEAEDEDEEKQLKFAVGCLLRLTNIPAEATYVEIKEVLVPAGETIGFVNHNKGDTEALVRFVNEGAAHRVLEKLTKPETEGGEAKKLVISGADISGKVLEGDEETAFWRDFIKTRKRDYRNKSHQKRTGRPRHYTGGRGGGYARRGVKRAADSGNNNTNGSGDGPTAPKVEAVAQ